ncbi:hypothetical protein DFH07DRAFT_250554 [Mycena maculata]|uniref:Uncharacterized protein n=1 Tax=Mycena maculata TaxID=230809 RepID=A0AAD7HPV8_9AGAR|nr:hypothetical protein DFH07DRAFT_250554 [Mycena maculata]
MWLPENLFRCREVGVRSGHQLHLERCVFPWNSRWFSHLTHLHLETNFPAQCPPMETFLSILVASPGLQTITLLHFSLTTDAAFPVALPHLSALRIRIHDAWICVRLLKSLVIPRPPRLILQALSRPTTASCTRNRLPHSRSLRHMNPSFTTLSY